MKKRMSNDMIGYNNLTHDKLIKVFRDYMEFDGITDKYIDSIVNRMELLSNIKELPYTTDISDDNIMVNIIRDKHIITYQILYHWKSPKQDGYELYIKYDTNTEEILDIYTMQYFEGGGIRSVVLHVPSNKITTRYSETDNLDNAECINIAVLDCGYIIKDIKN